MLKVKSVTRVLRCLETGCRWTQGRMQHFIALMKCTLVARRRSKNALAAGASRYAKTAVCNV